MRISDWSSDVCSSDLDMHGTEMRIPAAANGHFMVNVEINNRQVLFLVDTGASQIALSPEDAAAAGIRPRRDAYTGRAETAHGIVGLAPVRLPETRQIGRASRRAREGQSVKI